MSSRLEDFDNGPLKVRNDFITRVFGWAFWVVPSALAVVYFLSPNPAYDNLKDEISKNRAFNQVLRIADKDGRNGTSCDEWREVYESLGLKDTGNMGRDIDYKDLQRYISMSEGALVKR